MLTASLASFNFPSLRVTEAVQTTYDKLQLSIPQLPCAASMAIMHKEGGRALIVTFTIAKHKTYSLGCPPYSPKRASSLCIPGLTRGKRSACDSRQ